MPSRLEFSDVPRVRLRRLWALLPSPALTATTLARTSTCAGQAATPAVAAASTFCAVAYAYLVDRFGGAGT